jgi:hypothetical protein
MANLWNFVRRAASPCGPGKMPLLPCLLMFCLTAAVIFAIGRSRWHPIDPTYTATTYVVERVSNGRTAFSATEDSRQGAMDAANTQAETYAMDQQLQWRRSWDAPRVKATAEATRLRQERNDAEARLDAFERQRQADQVAVEMSIERKDASAMVDNPAWNDLDQQLSYLQRRREQLLVSRTPLHPAVKECEEQIELLRAKMAAISQKIPAAEAAAQKTAARLAVERQMKQVDDENQKKRAELMADVAKRRTAFEAAENALRQISQKQQYGAQFVVQNATAVQNPIGPDANWSRLLWTIFAASALMAFGIGAIIAGAAIEPMVANVAEIEAELGEPVLAVVPSEEPEVDAAAIRRQTWSHQTALAAGIVLMAACFIVAASGITGMD